MHCLAESVTVTAPTAGLRVPDSFDRSEEAYHSETATTV